jgi:hypothetical protein
MAKVGNYEIPFDPKGNQVHYFERYYQHEYHPNFEFDDTLTFLHFNRGRSAAYAAFQRSNGTQVTVFLTDLEPMLPRMAGGHISGRFTFTKRGQNYGCRVLPLASMQTDPT